jgi:DNA-3-methyladenine glycosylase I
LKNSEKKCPWCLGKVGYEEYHDNEWGVPLFDDHLLFEALILESFQSGLSWWTILQKRENFRKAFDNFDPYLVEKYDAHKVEELLQNEGIIRHRGKIEASISNAKYFIEIQKEFNSFSSFIWNFVNANPLQPNFLAMQDVPNQTTESILIAKNLKKRGFKFLGPTTVYSFMQGVGMTNDHLTSCFRYEEVRILAESSFL